MRIDQGQEDTARLSITFKEKTHAALIKRAEELGHPHSISAVTRSLVEQAIEYGLLEDRDPADAEQFLQRYYAASEELYREFRKRIDGLIEHLDIKDQIIAWQHEQLCELSTELYGPYKGDQAWRDEQARIKDAADADLPDDQAVKTKGPE